MELIFQKSLCKADFANLRMYLQLRIKILPSMEDFSPKRKVVISFCYNREPGSGLSLKKQNKKQHPNLPENIQALPNVLFKSSIISLPPPENTQLSCLLSSTSKRGARRPPTHSITYMQAATSWPVGRAQLLPVPGAPHCSSRVYPKSTRGWILLPH